jgi:UDP-N-acetylglucosamine acyltransferase
MQKILSGFPTSNQIHPTALIHPNVILGEGNKIGPFCIIGFPAEWKGKEKEGKVMIGNNNTFTGLVTIDSGAEGNTIIGDNCYFMKHSHAGHDVVVGNNVTVSCGAKIGGHTVVLNDCNIGLNAVIHQKQHIAEGCMIGAQAMVTKKLITEPYKTYAGNPAKLIGENDKHPNYPEYTINMKEFI